MGVGTGENVLVSCFIMAVTMRIAGLRDFWRTIFSASRQG
jgi:hypothetical protein